MASLKENIQQAIADFNSIEAAIEACGVDVPYDTDTKEYGNKVIEVYLKGAADAIRVYNADTHADFPIVGNETIIYKAQLEKLLYQWNPTTKEYEVLCANGGGTGGGGTYSAGDHIFISSDGKINVLTTNEAAKDNTRPITSAGVNTIVGNINILLETI